MAAVRFYALLRNPSLGLVPAAPVEHCFAEHVVEDLVRRRVGPVRRAVRALRNWPQDPFVHEPRHDGLEAFLPHVRIAREVVEPVGDLRP
jgi:hypothetical protein